jgi:hypothetical protein
LLNIIITGTNINDFYRDEFNNITPIEPTEKEKLIDGILRKKRLQLLKMDINKLKKAVQQNISYHT